MLLEDSLRGGGVVRGSRARSWTWAPAEGHRESRSRPRFPIGRSRCSKPSAARRTSSSAGAQRLPNLEVVWGRAEEQEADRYGVAVAKALAPPPVAAEWLLPLVHPGGAAVLWLGPTADLGAVAQVAGLVGGGEPEERDGLVVIPKLVATPDGFPRRPGMARKRPLA